MHRFVIESPESVTITVQVDVIYDPNQYMDQDEAAQDARDMIFNAGSDERNEYLQFERTVLIGQGMLPRE